MGLIGAVLTWWLGIGAGSSSRPPSDAPASTAPARPPGAAPIPDHAPRSQPHVEAPRPAPEAGLDLASIADRDERVAVAAVAAAIDAGTGFRYHKDGSVWQNRERRLPARPGGYYREYTVDTPGEGDRGARRIIGGQAGELFYTRDHYRSFVSIRGPTGGAR
ncbi:MAG: hypothetical protein K8W52_14465 [Deltaproteobacteria bacterium]|nr:hypothetical protein [Deltaproteobacteria bacterium]